MTWGRDQKRASFRLSVSDRFSASSFFYGFRINNFASLILIYFVFVLIFHHQIDSPILTCMLWVLGFTLYDLYLHSLSKKKKKKKRITGLIILESLSISKEIQPVNPKGSQSWIFIGKTDAEAETPIIWPPDANYWLTGKDPDARKDWRWEGKGMAKDEMVGWHHWLEGHEFE